jgi:hypothetical protein
MKDSAARIANSRPNRQKSGGPRTASGKARASRNALRHGLAALTHRSPEASSQIEQMAREICGTDTYPLLLEEARSIAECELMLRCVRAEKLAVVERLFDGTAIALANKRDNSIALAKEKMRETGLAFEEIARMKARYGARDAQWPLILGPYHVELPAHPGWWPKPPPERDEVDALCEALPDLIRLDRYERRAWSRRTRHLRRFMMIKSTSPSQEARRRKAP